MIIRTLVIALTLTFLTACGSLWYLGHLAFGDARVTGINAIPAFIFALVVLGAIFFGMYMIFATTDWLNDWITQKAVRGQEHDVKHLRDVTHLLTAQTKAMAGLDKAPPNPRTLGEGGLMFEEETFKSV
jgi:hypothetical protein